MSMVRTAKGRMIDMNQLFMDNQKAIALGNGSMNARGDIVKHGKVVKTVEELRKEYEEANTTSTTTTVSIAPKTEKVEKVNTAVEDLKPLIRERKFKKSTHEETEKPVVEEQTTTTKPTEETLSLSDILNQ